VAEAIELCVYYDSRSSTPLISSIMDPCVSFENDSSIGRRIHSHRAHCKFLFSFSSSFPFSDQKDSDRMCRFEICI